MMADTTLAGWLMDECDMSRTGTRGIKVEEKEEKHRKYYSARKGNYCSKIRTRIESTSIKGENAITASRNGACETG